MTDPPPEPEKEAPPVEPMVGPAPASTGPPPMDFLKPVPGKTESPVTPADKETQENAIDIIIGAVDLIHDRAADATGYGKGQNPDPTATEAEWGWRLTQKEIELWRKVIRFLVRRLKMKDWDVVIALVGLMIAEASKVIGFVAWRRAGHVATPGKAGGTAAGDIVIPDGAMA
jgi:hypothetical protein